MNEKEMNEALLNTFPEFYDEFKEYTSWQDGINTGAFITYEDLLLPHIVQALENNDTEFLEKSARFIEELLTNNDQYSQNVIYVGILEGLKSKCDNKTIEDLLLPVSKKEFQHLEY